MIGQFVSWYLETVSAFWESFSHGGGLRWLLLALLIWWLMGGRCRGRRRRRYRWRCCCHCGCGHHAHHDHGEDAESEDGHEDEEDSEAETAEG
jgi:hypothetical protein